MRYAEGLDWEGVHSSAGPAPSLPSVEPGEPLFFLLPEW